MSAASLPLVLCIGGHDPTGGAGLQADMETVAALGGHAMSLVTCLTAQDTRDVQHLYPQRPEHFLEQARCLLEDLRPAVVKIGLIGALSLIEAITTVLDACPRSPVVLDPVLAAGGGTDLASRALLDELRRHLLPRATLITPNGPEARRLTGEDDLERAAHRLLAAGCRAVLITGGHETGSEVTNTLYAPELRQVSRWERLPFDAHGSGCTLAAAAAAHLAHGRGVADAVREAQRFAHSALTRSFRPGAGQHLPRRVPDGAG